MGLLNKIKNALFEEEVVEEKPTAVVKQVESEKKEHIVINNYADHEIENQVNVQTNNESKKEASPIIFDVEDFIEEEPYHEEPKQEEKIVYGGYEAKEYDKLEEKDKFKPTPVISPVYGIMEKGVKVDDVPKSHERKSLDHLFVEEKKKTLDFDTIRQKAYGYGEPKQEEPIKEERNLLYDMEEEDKPGIEKISLGDAEEYFEDLGLEYNVDYTDLAKEKMTRSKKNKELTETIDEEIKENSIIEEEIKETKKTIKEIEKEEPDEKSLYDLIDMMYEDK